MLVLCLPILVVVCRNFRCFCSTFREGRLAQLGSMNSSGRANEDVCVNRRSRALHTQARKGKAGTDKPRSRNTYHARVVNTRWTEDGAHPQDPAASLSSDNKTSRQQKQSEQRNRKPGSPPNRTKSNKGSSRRRRDSDGIQAKKKGPIRRTRIFECNTLISTIPTSKKTSSQGLAAVPEERPNRSVVNIDERGLPLTSVGCAPVASLRASTSSNARAHFYDATNTRSLQEDCSRATQCRLRLGRQTNSARSLGSSGSIRDAKMPAAEDDRKLPAVQHRSKSSKRASCEGSFLVQLNPEESFQNQRKDCAKNAKAFVHILENLLEEFSINGPTFTGVLAVDELKDLVVSMFQTQKKFRDQGKPHRVDIGYHFCCGNNIKRIQRQPGLWSKIQAKGVNKSQDRDGIYTFNKPLSPHQGNTADSDWGERLQDVWMVVARIQGNWSISDPSEPQWAACFDSMVRPDSNVVVLKASAQFFPLAQFPSALLTQASATDGGSILKHIHRIHERLQIMVDNYFNSTVSRRPQRDHPQPLLSLNEHLDTVSNPIAWEVAWKVQAVVEKHAGTGRAKAIDFGNSILAVQAAVGAEEMAVLVDRMVSTQRRFLECKKPAYIEIGYHYCRGSNVKKMQQMPWFWSNIQSRGFNKSEDGDGIYTFNDPLGTRNRGNRRGFFDMRHSIRKEEDDDAWLLVARLQGNRQSANSASSVHSSSTGRRWDKNVDALVLSGRQPNDVVVLRTSAQFFPVLQFSAASMDAAASSPDQESSLVELQIVHQKLQRLFDNFFNNEAIVDGPEDVVGCRLQDIEEEVLEHCAPNSLDVTKSIWGSSQQLYKMLSHNKIAMNDDCSICLDSLRHTSCHQVARLRVCGHEFHYSCLLEALQHFDLCPICNQDLAPPSPKRCLQGLSPSGVMVVTSLPSTYCHGCWAPAGSFLLFFFIPAGVQKAYHVNPGAQYQSSNWKAFLPKSALGLRLLRRLQYAFLHGLLFTLKPETQLRTPELAVGRARIPLKTSPSPCATADDAAECFPDPAYFSRCNKELDRCGVPQFAECNQFVAEELEKVNLGDCADVAGFARQPQCTMSELELGDCARVLRGLQKHQHGWMFCKALPSPDGQVEKPMDFTTIETKLASHDYNSVEQYIKDVNLTFDNAIKWYSRENPVHYMAKQLKKKFKKDLRQLQLQI